MNISLDGSQIDQCVVLSKSLLTLFPDDPHAVNLHGNLLTQPNIRKMTTMRGQLFDAYAYGYFRTLLIKIDSPEVYKGKVLRVGGRNAIVEDVALDSVEFELRIDFTAHRGGHDATGYEWITDAYVLSLELRGANAFRDVLESVALDRGVPEGTGVRQWALQRVLTTRLKRLRSVLPNSQFALAATAVLRRAASAEPDLFMFLCEAIWFWLEHGPLPTDTIADTERLLISGLTHPDPNIRLAAIISTSRYCSQVAPLREGGAASHLMTYLVSSLGRLVSASFLSDTTYFEQVYHTCLYVLPTLNHPRHSMLLSAVELLKSIPHGEEGLSRCLETVDDPGSVALLLLILLWRAPWLQDVEIISRYAGAPPHVRALRAEFLYGGKTISVLILCSVVPDDDLFLGWLRYASKSGVIPASPNTLRVAARATKSLQEAVDESIICGADLVDLIVNDARLKQALDPFVD